MILETAGAQIHPAGAKRPAGVISLIGAAHGVSHYYQLAFATMLLIVRQEAGLSFQEIGLLAGIFYGVSGIAQTMAGFAVDRFGARPIRDRGSPSPAPPTGPASSRSRPGTGSGPPGSP